MFKSILLNINAISTAVGNGVDGVVDTESVITTEKYL